MKVKFWVALVALAIVAFPPVSAAGNTSGTAEAKLAAVNALRNLPLSFEPAATPGRFVARSGGGYTISIGATESSVAVPGAAAGTASILRFGFEGANAATSIEGFEPLPGVSNYYVGNDPAKWRLGVKNFAKLRAAGVYPGVDVVYYGDQRRLEFDFLVAPNASPDPIALAFSGMDKLSVAADGDLVAEVNGQPVRFAKPYAYQKVAGEARPVSVEYVVTKAGKAQLQIGEYDKNLELVIDPTLSYSTYLGGSQGDTANGIAVDKSSYAYVTGQTCSLGKDTNPVTFPNPGNVTLKGVLGACDAYVTKLDPTGTIVEFTTFIGGTNPTPANGVASGNGIALDNLSLNPNPVAPNGLAYAPARPNVYIVGTTNFADLPLAMANPTGGTNAYNGGDSDAFIAILDSSNGTLLNATYLGGNGIDSGNAIAVDPQQNVIVAGQTNSFNFPAYNGFEPITETYVAFVTKLDFGLHIAPPLVKGASPMSPRQPSKTDTACSPGQPCPPAPDPSHIYYFFSAVYGGQLVAPPPTWPLNPNGSVYGFYEAGVAIASNSISILTPVCSQTSPPTNYPSMIAIARMQGASQATSGGVNWEGCASFQLKGTLPDAGGFYWEILAISPFIEPTAAATVAYGVALDPVGDVFVAGGSDTADLHPSLPGPAPASGGTDWLPQADTYRVGTGAWIIKLLGSDTGTSPAGTPIYLTPLGTSPTVDGGNGTSQNVNAARGIAVDNQGRAYVVGTANGGIYTTTSALHESIIGAEDAFILRMNTSGSGIDYATYLGGTGNDQGLAVAVDAGNYAYIVGSTQSTDIPVINALIDGNGNTLGQLKGTQPEAYIVKLTPDATGMIMSAYLGGSGGDQGNAIALSQTGNGDIYVAGNTNSYDFPVVPVPGNNTVPGISAYAGNGDAFATKISGASFPTVTVAPASQSLVFANQAVGFSSAATQTVTLTSTGVVPVAINNIAISGDFSQANNCGTGLTAAGGNQTSCTITVTFTPSAVGTRSGTLTISDDATSSPQTVGLQGNGVLVQDTISPLSLTFASQLLGTTSTAQTVTVQNTDPTQTMILSSVIVGGQEPSDFLVSSNLCTTLLTPGQTCTIGVEFSPTAPGSRIAQLIITGNGTNMPAVSLTGIGNGTGSPGGTSTTTADFSVSTTNVSVAQGQQGNINVTLTPVNGFNQTVTLTCSVPPPATCAVNPASVQLSGTTNATVTVSVPGSGGGSSGYIPKGSSSSSSLHHGNPWRVLMPFSMFGLVFLGRRRRFWLPLLVLCLCLALSFVNCGGGTGGGSSSSATLAPGSYQATVTATYTAGSISHSSSSTLTVN